MPETTFTAPLAVIMVNDQKIGKVRNLNFTENIQRGDVMGLGELTLQEAPATAIRCQFSAGSYMIDMKRFGTVKDPFWPVDAKNPGELIRTILLGEKPVALHIYRKTAGNVDSNDIVTSDGPLSRIGIIQDCLLNSRTWEISEGNLAGRNLNGIYFTPIYQI